MTMLTGHDGQKGACKDMVDLVRYAVMSDIWDWTAAKGGRRARLATPQREGRTEGAQGVATPRRRRVWW